MINSFLGQVVGLCCMEHVSGYLRSDHHLVIWSHTNITSLDSPSLAIPCLSPFFCFLHSTYLAERNLSSFSLSSPSPLLKTMFLNFHLKLFCFHQPYSPYLPSLFTFLLPTDINSLMELVLPSCPSFFKVYIHCS
jgi:hypothetical protein